MSIGKEQKERIEKKKQEWMAGGHHTGLMSVAWVYKKEGVPLQDAITDMQAFYASIEEHGKHDEHVREVEEAFSKVYEFDYSVRKQPSRIDTGASYKIEQSEWLDLQGSLDTELKQSIFDQDTSEKRTATTKALKSLFKYTSGRIRYGQTLNTIRWAETDNDFEDMRNNELQCVYMTTTTFGDVIDDVRQEELAGKGAKYIAYSSKDENVLEKACVLLEFDEPMGEDRISKDAFGYLTDEEKSAYRGKILSHTCMVLERAGLRPTTVTFSGNRSYHCLFRLSRPVTKEEWEKYEERLKTIYMRIGADEATLSYNRMTRVPKGCTLTEAQVGETQRVMYLDDTAEVSLDEFADRLEKIAKEISEVKEKAGKITLAMEKVIDPKTGREKWEYSPAKWERSLADMGIKVKYRRLDNQGNYELTLSHDGGLYHVISAQGALDHIVKMYNAQDYMAGAMFREKRSSKMTSEKYEQYAGLAEPYREVVDTKEKVFVPYRNGLLEITAKGGLFHSDSYEGRDVPDDSPTLTREWSYSPEKGELEEFIELACGREDGDGKWKERKEAIMTLLGYELSGRKEKVNYLPVIVEKSIEDHNGGTGKSLITKSLSYMRKTCFLDFKTWDDDQRFFFADMAKTLPRIARCEDLPKSFDLEKMFNRLTEGFKADVKGKDAITLDMNTMPKFIATSNCYLKGTGNSYARRYREYEITDYWRGKDPEKHFGHLLYFDWDADEWARFDSFMARCTGKYLKEGMMEFRGENSAEKSLEVNLGDLKDFFDETFESLPVWTTATELIASHEEWYKTVHAGKYQRISYTTKTIKAKLKTYCQLRGLALDDNEGSTCKHNGESKRWICVDAASGNANDVGDKRGDENGYGRGDANGDAASPSEMCSENDPLFGDFCQESSKGDENPVTGDKNSEDLSPIQVPENEVVTVCGDDGDTKSTLFTREREMKNGPKEVDFSRHHRHLQSLGLDGEDGEHSEKVKAWVEGLRMNGCRILDESGNVVEYERDGLTYQQEYGIFVEVPIRRAEEMPF